MIEASASMSVTSELLADRLSDAARKRALLRRTLAVVFALAGTLLGLLVPMLRHRSYVATGRLQMFLRSPPSNRQGRLGKSGLADQRELMMGRTFQQQVLERMDPADRLRLVHGVRVRPGKHAEQLRAQQATAALSTLDVEVQPKTLMMEITYSSPDPALAAAVVRAAMAVAQDLGVRLRTEDAARVSAALEGRLDELEAHIRSVEEALDAEQRRLGHARVDLRDGLASSSSTSRVRINYGGLNRRAMKRARRQGRNVTLYSSSVDLDQPAEDTLLITLTRAAGQSRLLRKLAETRAAAFHALEESGQDDLLEMHARGQQRQQVDQLRLLEAQQQAELTTMAQQLGPSQPARLRLQAAYDEGRRQLAQLDRQLVASADGAVQMARAREIALTMQVNRRRQLVSKESSQEKAGGVSALSAAVDEELDTSQREILRSAQVSAALKASGFYVVDVPSVPPHTRARAYRQAMLIGAAAGLLLSLLANTFLYARGLSRWPLEKAEAALGMGVVCALPRLRRPRTRGQSPPGEPESGSAAQGLYPLALRELAQQLIQLPLPHPTRVVLVSSAKVREGKTTLVVELATVLARLDTPVLLVEADLHGPALRHRFGLNAIGGLHAVLAGGADPSTQVQAVLGVCGLDVLAAGRASVQPSMLVQSERMDQLIAEARQAGYHSILIDSPPVLASSDAAYLARLADVLLIVARYGQVELSQLRACGRHLHAMEPSYCGLVVNAVPVEDEPRDARSGL